MKINNKQFERVQFCDLNHGDVFIHGDSYYMKVTFRRQCALENAVSLSDGLLVHVVPDDFVRPVDGEFVVKKVSA